MEQELKNKIAKYVEREGVKQATTISHVYLSSFSYKINDGYEHVDKIMSELKFSLAVLEYLHCDSEKVAAELKEYP